MTKAERKAELQAFHDDLAMQAYQEQAAIEAARELCISCGEQTGEPFSLYRQDDTGPYCRKCLDPEPLVEAIEKAHEQSRDQ